MSKNQKHLGCRLLRGNFFNPLLSTLLKRLESQESFCVSERYFRSCLKSTRSIRRIRNFLYCVKCLKKNFSSKFTLYYYQVSRTLHFTISSKLTLPVFRQPPLITNLIHISKPHLCALPLQSRFKNTRRVLSWMAFSRIFAYIYKQAVPGIEK